MLFSWPRTSDDWMQHLKHYHGILQVGKRNSVGGSISMSLHEQPTSSGFRDWAQASPIVLIHSLSTQGWILSVIHTLSVASRRVLLFLLLVCLNIPFCKSTIGDDVMSVCKLMFIPWLVCRLFLFLSASCFWDANVCYPEEEEEVDVASTNVESNWVCNIFRIDV